MFYPTLVALGSGDSSLFSCNHARVALEDDLVQNLHVNYNGNSGVTWGEIQEDQCGTDSESRCRGLDSSIKYSMLYVYHLLVIKLSCTAAKPARVAKAMARARVELIQTTPFPAGPVPESRTCSCARTTLSCSLTPANLNPTCHLNTDDIVKRSQSKCTVMFL
ncbi:hypothetical protein BGY98DRAFT_504571 [Russula aff. rugulosa BPL654]|nr:hypothetical protein BGY98DRAFT_504571 [Russula aff. rugulosa BPL654]